MKSRNERSISKSKTARRNSCHKSNMKKALTAGIVLIIALFLICFFGNNLIKTKAGENGIGHKCYKSITLKANDTLWDIANEYMESSEYLDVTEYITELKSINNLQSDNITAGQSLLVSYYVYD